MRSISAINAVEYLKKCFPLFLFTGMHVFEQLKMICLRL